MENNHDLRETIDIAFIHEQRKLLRVPLWIGHVKHGESHQIMPSVPLKNPFKN